VLHVQNKTFSDEVLFFEDLESDIQDAIIDLIVSIIENQSKTKEDHNV